MTGRISSFQSMGAVDGPGLRCVVFMQGCPLRCAYCHNPETWTVDGGEEVSVEDLIAKIERYRPYVIETGGVTVSGGEPVLQAPFVAELFRQLQAKGYHTALDTSGIGNLQEAEEVLRYTNLVIADLKFTDAESFQHYCHGNLQLVYDFLQLTVQKEIPLWIRQVIVPGINDTAENVLALKKVLSGFPNVVNVELLPFRTLCKSKYEDMNIPFPLSNTPDCSKETIEDLTQYLDIADSQT